MIEGYTTMIKILRILIIYEGMIVGAEVGGGLGSVWLFF